MNNKFNTSYQYQCQYRLYMILDSERSSLMLHCVRECKVLDSTTSRAWLRIGGAHRSHIHTSRVGRAGSQNGGADGCGSTYQGEAT